MPVLHIDFTGSNFTLNNSLDLVLDYHLKKWEKDFGITEIEQTIELRFQRVIHTAYEQTGKKVVILVDEYDKPLLDTIELPTQQETFRNILRGVFGNLKRMDAYIKFAFLTGITRFGKLNIFSDLNNLNDISLTTEFSGICGITSDELHRYFHDGVEAFAEKYAVSVEEMYDILRENYDGYHFSTQGSPDIYNPFSLLKSLMFKEVEDYWFSTGTPLFLVKRIQSQAIELRELNSVTVLRRQIENVPFDMKGDPIPVLYQSGYLTIKDYNPRNRFITLGFPNKEVEQGFMNQLLEIYIPETANKSVFSITKFINDVERGDIEGFMQRLQSFYAGINYDSFDLMNLEQHYQNVIYLLFRLIGYNCHAEYRTATGRIDLLIETDRFVYVFEFKLNKTAKEAIEQIDTKEYLLPFKPDSRKIFKIGANFNFEKKNLDSWIIETS